MSKTNGRYVFPSWAESAGVSPDLFTRFEQLVYNVTTSRADLLRRFTDPRRDINDECGYPRNELTAEGYQDLYEREAIAARVVEVYPDESWKVQPTIFEDEDAEEKTEFETAWDDLDKQIQIEESYYQEEESSAIWDYIKRADILSGIGHYGIILLGLDDGQPLEQPARRRNGQQLVYLRPFSEALAQITRMNADQNSPRYGLPEQYLVTFNDPNFAYIGGAIGATTSTQNVHWTRVIHIADNLGSSEVFGMPRMRQVLRKLIDIEKISGGSGEGYWRGAAFPGLSLETHPSTTVDVTIRPGEIKDEMEKFMNGLQRYLALTGMTAKTLAPNCVDPTPFINSKIDEICVKLAVPKRIFLGSERGELSSAQDQGSWDDRLRSRQMNFISPRMIKPLVNRLINLGVLPTPKQFKIDWPDISKTSDAEKATVAATRTQALATYVSGQVETIMPPVDFFTRVMGMEEDEALEVIESAATELKSTLERREQFGMQPQPMAEEEATEETEETEEEPEEEEQPVE